VRPLVFCAVGRLIERFSGNDGIPGAPGSSIGRGR